MEIAKLNLYKIDLHAKLFKRTQRATFHFTFEGTVLNYFKLLQSSKLLQVVFLSLIFLKYIILS